MRAFHSGCPYLQFIPQLQGSHPQRVPAHLGLDTRTYTDTKRASRASVIAAFLWKADTFWIAELLLNKRHSRISPILAWTKHFDL